MLVTTILVAALSLTFAQASSMTYQQEIERWQHDRQTALEADDGWLTVVGLFWLKEGENTVGAASGTDIALPRGSAPARVGEFDFHNGVTTFRAAPGVEATVNGQRVSEARMKPDASGSPDILRVRDLSLFVIQRGNRYGIRLKDKNSPLRRAFTGLKYFPVNEKFRLQAKFVPYHPPKAILVPNILGEVTKETSPGYVEFRLDGRVLRLDPVSEEDTLFFIFKDMSSGKETYPAGRFLYARSPTNGEVILDFNKAYNPPCAFTPHATCPLPPQQNYLPLRIEAGELRYGH